jgi:hypothetical protein
VLHLWSAFVVIWGSVGTEFSKTSLMLLLEPKDGISAQSCDVAEDESGQSYVSGKHLILAHLSQNWAKKLKSCSSFLHNG